MRVFGYCRVSTTEQVWNSDSLATQRQQITGYAMVKGWRIADDVSFVDGGLIGSVLFADLPEGKRLLTTARKGDIIITSRLDRAFRSAVDALDTLEELKELPAVDRSRAAKAGSLSSIFSLISQVTTSAVQCSRGM